MLETTLGGGNHDEGSSPFVQDVRVACTAALACTEQRDDAPAPGASDTAVRTALGEVLLSETSHPLYEVDVGLLRKRSVELEKEAFDMPALAQAKLLAVLAGGDALSLEGEEFVDKWSTASGGTHQRHNWVFARARLSDPSPGLDLGRRFSTVLQVTVDASESPDVRLAAVSVLMDWSDRFREQLTPTTRRRASAKLNASLAQEAHWNTQVACSRVDRCIYHESNLYFTRLQRKRTWRDQERRLRSFIVQAIDYLSVEH